MRFYKYHGTGNDFIVLDGMDKGPFLSAEEVTALCCRHTGIGADGVIFACASTSAADAAMRIFNADGSEAEMCGNGIRCLAKYLFERSCMPLKEMAIETGAGIRLLRLTMEGGEVSEVEVEMGMPEFTSEILPEPDDRSRPGIVAIETEDGNALDTFCLSMGNPHCVLFVEDVAEAPVSRLGPFLETNPIFPDRSNVEFAQIVDGHHMLLRVWERGVGETLACGTGACAASVAALHYGYCTSPIDVSVPGGDLRIRVDEYGHVHMSGPAVEVFSGETGPALRGRSRGVC